MRDAEDTSYTAKYDSGNIRFESMNTAGLVALKNDVTKALDVRLARLKRELDAAMEAAGKPKRAPRSDAGKPRKAEADGQG